MAKEIIKAPDLGGAEDVDVIEVFVKAGEEITADTLLVALETDKASMEVPADKAGKIIKLLVKEGDKISQGTPLLELETQSAGDEKPAAKEQPTEAAAQQEAPTQKAAAPKKQAAAAEGSTEVVTASVPDIGSDDEVQIIELHVAVGDTVSEGDTLVTLESDKASMEVPAEVSGEIVELLVKEGDNTSTGKALAKIKTARSGSEPATDAPKTVEQPSTPTSTPKAAAKPETAAGGEVTAVVPDIGSDDQVQIIEINVSAGDEISAGDTILTLESDKASMEIPAEVSGIIVKLLVKEGDVAGSGTKIAIIKSADAVAEQSAGAGAEATPEAAPAEASAAPASRSASSAAPASAPAPATSGEVYAGPAVRLLARELEVDLAKVTGSGPRGRIQKEDLHDYLKGAVKKAESGASAVSGGSGIPAVPAVDFAKFGEIEMIKLSKIARVTADNMARSWLNVPHVTQWDDADITELEEFRKALKDEAEKAGVKVTPVAFIIKAVAVALKANPVLLRSLHADGEHLVQKKYIHIGMAVDTPRGLVVPVIRDADKKSIFEIASDIGAMAAKARDGKLSPADMQGGCFTVSSLGGIGGNGFTPIVNTPEVGILGVSRSQIKPMWNGSEFVPRLMLPLSVSYDHRVVNGADCGRFFTYLVQLLSDIRRLAL